MVQGENRTTLDCYLHFHAVLKKLVQIRKTGKFRARLNCEVLKPKSDQFIEGGYEDLL